MTERFDAIVIGGDASGLAAAALLVKAGRKTLLVERGPSLPAADVALRALDPALVKTLKLTKRGLRYAAHDLPLALPRPGGQSVVLGRDRHVAARGIAVLSPADAGAFADYRAQLFGLARSLRKSWWDGRPLAETQVQLKPPQRALLEHLGVTSAVHFLGQHFESDALKAALAFDAASCGFAPSEPGSALALAWCAAQEMCGVQGAVALPQGLVPALAKAAVGAEIRTDAPVSSLLLEDGRVAGVELASGARAQTPLVLSSLTRAATLALAPPALSGLGAARPSNPHAAEIGALQLVFSLNRAPGGLLSANRVVIAERAEAHETATAAARLGRMPDEPLLELILAPPDPAAIAGSLGVTVWPVPLDIAFDHDALVRQVTATIKRHIPALAEGITRCDVVPARSPAPVTVERLRASAATRIATPLAGLLLCGRDAEPVDAVSGNAARHAVQAALAPHRKAAP